jgi:prepilin-type N-terminal cleavage/methylation domain-containing protein
MNRSRLSNIANPAPGFTLIEILVALFLLTSIALPLITGLCANTNTLRTEESLVATWLLEQEAASVRLFTDEGLMSKRRIVDGKAWVIQIRAEGSPLAKYTLTALKQGKKRGEVVVYGIKAR